VEVAPYKGGIPPALKVIRKTYVGCDYTLPAMFHLPGNGIPLA
jgi:hypothetical protein